MANSAASIVRRLTGAGNMVEITMPDGLEFTTASIAANDDEIQAEADEVREFLASIPDHANDDYLGDEDPDSDGYGWERRALRGIGA